MNMVNGSYDMTEQGI